MIRETRIVIFSAAVLTAISVCFLLQYWRSLLKSDYQISIWNSSIQTTADFTTLDMKSGSTSLPASQLSGNLARNAKTTKSHGKFIYLTQTESCLSNGLLGPGVFGNVCKSDVVVLSWKEPCTLHFSRQLKHIKYIYEVNKTWSEGRNILYRFAKNISTDYLYYIFMDDDLSFNFTDSSFEQRYRRLGIRWPLHAFEDFLLKREPAIGMPLYCSVCLRIDKTTGERRTRCCDLMKILVPLPDYLPVTINFDAAFNAFHKNAIDWVLPYRLVHEKNSWWQSQKFVILAADLIFRGQILRFSPVTVLNRVHREYPREDWDNWRSIFDILKAKMPKKYRDQVDYTPHWDNIDVVPIVRNNTVFTPLWSMEIPSGKMTVTPFKQFYT